MTREVPSRGATNALSTQNNTEGASLTMFLELAVEQLRIDKSAISLAKNGKASSGKRTRAVNIGCFHIEDQID